MRTPAWLISQRLRLICWCAIGTTVVVGTLLINPHSIIPLAWAVAISQGIALLLMGRDECVRVLKALSFYCLVALVLYVVQLSTIPEYYGFSGPLGIGADDAYYFSLGSPDLPASFPLRAGFYLREDPYGQGLRLFGNLAFALFRSVHPLDLLFTSVALVALLPSLVARSTQVLANSREVAATAWWLTLTCPFILGNSTILVRDGLVTAAFAGALTGILTRRWPLLILSILLAGFLRLQHGVMLVGIVWLVGVASVVTRNDSQRCTTGGALTVMGIWAVPLVVAVPILLTFSGTGLLLLLAENPLVRQEYLTFLIEGAARDTSTSTFYAISQMPLPARLPLAGAFFFLSPLLDLSSLMKAHLFIPRNYLFSIFSFLMIGYAAAYVVGTIDALERRRWTNLTVILALIVGLLAISQASMQLRHKLPLMALFYPTVACGLHAMNTPARRATAVLVALLIGSVEILFNGFRFLA